jgi:hypothetical protein
MRIYKGTVKSKKGLLPDFVLSVLPDGADYDIDEADFLDGCVAVEYVSPYGGSQYAGAVFLPEAEQQILFCSVDDEVGDKFYYMGSIMNPSWDITQEFSPTRVGDPAPGGPHDSEDYEYNNQSMSYGIKTPLQQQLVMQEYHDPKKDSKRIKLESQRGHGLYLDDSSNTNKVNLKSAWNGAALQLRDENADKDPSQGPESVNLYGKGNVTFRTWEGHMKHHVRDGGNISMINNSTGGNAVSGGPEEKMASFGNVHLHTDRGEIRISSGGNGVLIDCFGSDPDQNIPYASFQVRSQNKIHLYASNGIDLKSGGDINIRSEGNVNIQGQEVQLNPTYDVNDQIGIRKTNDEILHEKNDGVPQHFFTEDPTFSNNYTEGRNNDPKLY